MCYYNDDNDDPCLLRARINVADGCYCCCCIVVGGTKQEAKQNAVILKLLGCQFYKQNTHCLMKVRVHRALALCIQSRLHFTRIRLRYI